MKQFIRLHNTDTNTVVLVSVNEIQIVDTEVMNNRNVAKIYCSFIEDGFIVNETPEKIYSLLKDRYNTDIIRLHNSDSNSVILCSMNSIKLVDTETHGRRTVSRVYTSYSIQGFTVNETVDKIYAMISDVNKTDKKNTKTT